MEIDYKELINLFRTRKLQISDVALITDEFNKEYTNLTKIEDLIRQILKNQS